MTSRSTSIWLDGAIAVGIASLTSLALSMSSEDSYKYVEAHLRYWLLVGVGVFVQGLHALSKFRDGTFQRHKETVVRQAEADKTGVSSVVVDTIQPKPVVDPQP